jgi:Domain of unknown function (DUF1835)
MIYHVLPGDAYLGEFKKAEIQGEVIVFREALIVGPIDAETPDEFWDARAKFILAEYSEDEIVFHERVADELEKLSEVEADDEINLWFEYELFCSVNMWFCLSRLADSGANVYRVEPVILKAEDRWSGFARMTSDNLRTCFESRQLFSESDLKLGSGLWNAFVARDGQRLIELSENSSPRFPYLDEVAKAAAEIETRPYEVINQLRSEGINEFGDLFPEFTKRAGVYGFGDLQVQRILDRSV